MTSADILCHIEFAFFAAVLATMFLEIGAQFPAITVGLFLSLNFGCHFGATDHIPPVPKLRPLPPP